MGVIIRPKIGAGVRSGNAESAACLNAFWL
jgi:hypothetical protein